MDWGVIDAIAVAILGGAFAYGAYMGRNRPANPAVEQASSEAAGMLYHPHDDMGNKPLTG
jgi:hypothetical protein